MPSVTVHARLGAFYLSRSPAEEPTTFDALSPSIEAVYHLCKAGDYLTAASTLHDKVYFGNVRTLVNRFGAYDSAIEILEQFFAGGNVEGDLLVGNLRYRAWILDELALSFMSLGRLEFAKPFLARELAEAAKLGNPLTVSRAHQNLAEVLIYAGDLAAAEREAATALASAREISNGWYECFSLCRQAWALFLQLRTAEARELYARADQIQLGLDGYHLYHQRGIEWATALCRLGEYSAARNSVTENLRLATQYQWTRVISQCHRVFGDLESHAGNSDKSREHYEEALAHSRRAAHLPALIEALLGFGRWSASRGLTDPARGALEEALTYAVEGQYAARGDVMLRYAQSGGYQVYEADIRTALGTVLAASGDLPAASAEISRAREISRACGYGWGLADADAARGLMRAGMASGDVAD